MTEMADQEQTLFRGSSSLLIRSGTLIFCLLIAGVIVGASILAREKLRDYWLVPVGLMLIPLGIAIWNIVLIKTRVYEITTERIKKTEGVLSKRTDELELYRVQDTSLIEPLSLRMFGKGNILLQTGDASNPKLTIEAISGAAQVREQLRKHVEICRDRKRTRVSELEGGNIT